MLYSVEANLYNTFESEIDRCHRSSHPKGTGVVFGGSGIRFKKRHSVEKIFPETVFGGSGINDKRYSVEMESGIW